ncbi:LysR family transcriptional regulator [Kocuria sp. TGY1127_2]|uniref:LysR family transcriptional regulator n=1 Tax=Kocuria sp. TGY1127_2 TaxID=2711328 RepID=UPI0015B95BD9|nr:LysR family transcriptional regulator [Kocuria sp. TGY1127_2]
MELRHLHHFLAVADELNFSRAAARVNISASPLSRSIQQLEREVGGPLFIRGTRKVEITPLGRALQPRALKVVEEMDALTRDMRRQAVDLVELSIGMTSVRAELARAIIDDVVLQTEPNAAVRLELFDSFAQMDLIVDGSLSLGLVNRRRSDHRLHYLPIMIETPAFALPDTPHNSALTEVLPEDIVGLRLLLQPGFGPIESPLVPYVEAAGEVVQVNAAVVGGLAAVIAEGDACCLTIANEDAPWHRHVIGDGVVIRPMPPELQATTYLCWRADRDNDDDLGAILRLLHERFPQPLQP